MQWIKDKWGRFKRWIIAFFIGGIALAASSIFIPFGSPIVPPPSIIYDGVTIDFTFTDEVANESMIIWTDKEVYTPLWAWNGFDVYIAIENKSGKDENIEIQSYFGKNFTVEGVGIFDSAATTTVVEDVYIDVCVTLASTTIPVINYQDCYEEKTGQIERVVTGVWNPVTVSPFNKEKYEDDIKTYKVISKKSPSREAKQKISSSIKKNAISYYKVKLKSNENFTSEEFDFEVVGDKGGYGFIDPAVLTDDFNSYDDGDLNGQGSWSGSVELDIQGTTVKEGAKAVKVVGKSPYPGELKVSKTGDSVDDGRMTIYVRKSENTGNDTQYFRLYNGGTLGINNNFLAGAITFAAANGDVATGLSADVWYLYEVEWRSSDDKTRARVDGGTWTDWVAANAVGPYDKIEIGVSADSVMDFFFDFIAEDPIAEAPGAATSTSQVIDWF